VRNSRPCFGSEIKGSFAVHPEPFAAAQPASAWNWQVITAGKDRDDSPMFDGSRAGQIKAQRSKQIRVLIVEDEMFVAWHLEDMAQGLELTVGGIASSGEEAVAKAAAIEPDLMLMDVTLGSGIDGGEAARRIVGAHAAPVIFITAYSDAATLARIRQDVPGARVLHKPVTLEALENAVADVLERRRN
jgi:CheY-like chemotaxis protein